MFLVNIVVDNIILDRTIFHNIREASDYAQQKVSEKVWNIDDNCVYYGDVEACIYEPKLHETTDFVDEYILSFTHPIGNSTNVL
jgi:hypothetical protein